ncbi:hypothetical protein BDN72DRAFT_898030 [Pluteus cervinus]|uniref:Uncharacterized protein n=1 Tax=Pluteus cervinus TaxID=181527 RepID=A0ACD3ASM1_9AGAR|nr:hypothetical protein BDN72DRAFT_898030 [Pluteus cervinus]
MGRANKQATRDQTVPGGLSAEALEENSPSTLAVNITESEPVELVTKPEESPVSAAPTPPRSPSPVVSSIPPASQSNLHVYGHWPPGSTSVLGHGGFAAHPRHPHGHVRAESAALTYRNSFEANMLAPGRISIANGAISNTVAHNIRVRPQRSYSTMRLNPTNFVSMSRKSIPQKKFFLYRASKSISGSFAVNPFLHIPDELLPPVKGSGPSSPVTSTNGAIPAAAGSPTSPTSGSNSPTPTIKEEPRKNLRLDVENGGIDVDIFLVGDYMPMDDSTIVHTTLDLKLSGRYINRFPLIARIHTPNLVRPPFHLVATSIDGYVSIHLPASFHGPVTVSVNTTGDLASHISLSNALKENSFILNETSSSRTYFVGEVGGWSKSELSWKGDKVDVILNSGKARFQMFGEKDWDSLRKITWKFS